MSRFVICVTSAGRRVGLIRSFREDAAKLGVEIAVLALDRSPDLSSACAVADFREAVPSCADPAYPAAVLDACRRHRATVVIPTIDTELPFLAASAGAFASAGIHVVVSDSAAVAVARDKLATARTLAAAGVPVPWTSTLSETRVAPATARFPAVIKPLDGSCSKGLRFADGWDDIPGSLDGPSNLHQERCVGPEYTVNAFVDRSGTLRCAIPHLRIEVRGGEVSKGRTERVPALSAIARGISGALPGLRGPFCFQAIMTEQGPRVFEINARFGGGYPLAHAAGATFGGWIIREALGRPSGADDNWSAGVLMLRYDSAVYLRP